MGKKESCEAFVNYYRSVLKQLAETCLLWELRKEVTDPDSLRELNGGIDKCLGFICDGLEKVGHIGEGADYRGGKSLSHIHQELCTNIRETFAGNDQEKMTTLFRRLGWVIAELQDLCDEYGRVDVKPQDLN